MPNIARGKIWEMHFQMYAGREGEDLGELVKESQEASSERLTISSLSPSIQHYHHHVDGHYDGYPANYHQSHYHQVGFCHNDKGWKYDTVKHLLAEYFPMARVELAIGFKGNQKMERAPIRAYKKLKIT